MKVNDIAMAMQWHSRAKNRLQRPAKLPVVRCMIFSIFIMCMIILYWRLGIEQRTIQSPNLVPVAAQTDKQVEKASIPAPREETKMPIAESVSNASETSVTSASSQPVPDLGVLSEDSQRADDCEGRRIFIYQIPVEFNELLAKNCHNWPGWKKMCEDISNLGFGPQMQVPESDPMASVLQPPSAWYRTEQFSLEVIFHERLKTYPCLTKNPDEASMFYIPVYHTLDLIRNLYLNDKIPERDRLGLQLLEWLRTQAPWQRHHGHRHVLVLGRIVWDYLRGEEREDDTWGSNFLRLSELGNVTKLLIERSPWRSDTVGIPYPTAFHPQSDADLRTWQTTVRKSNRHLFVSVAGGRRNITLTGAVRDEVFNQCGNSTKCNHLDCSYEVCVQNPQRVIKMGLESVFCLQPPGDSPTRKGVFDSLQAGCIPVLFHKQQAAQQYLFHLPVEGPAYSIMIPQENVTENNYDIMAHLSRIPPAEVNRLQENIIELLPQLLYRNPVLTGTYTSKDAIDVTLDGLWKQFQVQSKGDHPSS